MVTHGAVASAELGEDYVFSVLSENWRQAPVTDRVLAALEYLDVLTMHPDTITVEQLQAWQERGLTPLAFEVLTAVCFCFSVMNRMVDSFGMDIDDEQVEQVRRGMGRNNTITGRVLQQHSEATHGEFPAGFVALRESIYEGDGDLDVATRRAIATRVIEGDEGVADLPHTVVALVDTIATKAFEVTPGMIEDLKVTYSEAAIYEMVFTTSAATGIRRMARLWPLIAQLRR